MSKTELILFVFAMSFLAFRLYQKYTKKNKNLSGTNTNPNMGTGFPSSSKDDDYEPYSKK